FSFGKVCRDASGMKALIVPVWAIALMAPGCGHAGDTAGDDAVSWEQQVNADAQWAVINQLMGVAWTEASDGGRTHIPQALNREHAAWRQQGRKLLWELGLAF